MTKKTVIESGVDAKRIVLALVAICIVALLLRAGCVYKLGRVLSWSDERVYATLGYNIASGHGLSVNDDALGYRPTMFVPPGQAAFVASAFLVFNPILPDEPGKIVVLAKCVLALIGVLTCLYACGIAKEITGNPRVGVVAALGSAIYPAHVYASSTLYPIVLLTFFCAAAAYYCVRAKNGTKTNLSAALAGFCIGLAALTAAYELVIAPLAALWLIGLVRAQWKRRLVPATLLILATVLTVAPWMARNYFLFGQATISGNLGTCLRLGYFGAKLMPDGRVALLKEAPQSPMAGYSEAVADAKLRAEAIAAIRQNPGHFAKLCLGKFRNFWDGYPHHPITGRQPKKWMALGQSASVSTLYICAFLGLIMIPELRRFYGLAALFIFPTLLSCVLTISTPRYRYPLDTLFIVSAAAVFVAAPQWFKKTQQEEESAFQKSTG